MPSVTTSPLGWTYIGLTVGWTVILVGGMLFLHQHRQLPFLQIRKLPLVFISVILLHLYGIACMIGPTLSQLIPCDAQFWIMSIYLPFGMAMLQAANSHFQYIASQQRKFAKFNNLEDYKLSEKTLQVDPSLSWWKRTMQRLRKIDQTTRIVVYISIGMAVQLALTFIVYFGSEMFHPSYGFFHLKVPGTEQRKVACLTGWEWWLSIVWQFFWAWVYAPYMLWKTRNIRDTHGWRIQTICCCIAGLPASPLWLAALYIPEMAPVNAVVIPPMWFAFSIFFIEIFMIFFPCWQVIKTHQLQQETLDAIASWEQRHKISSDDDRSFSTSAYGGSTIRESIIAKSVRTKTTTHSRDSRKSDTLTMVALESALTTNPLPLLEFAALKDFSGENISFLSHVSDWKRACNAVSSDPDKDRTQFIRAVRIYSNFVSLEYSDFPVNISSRVAKELHKVFGHAARKLNRPLSGNSDSSDGATPFDDIHNNVSTTALKAGVDLEGTLGQANLQSVTKMVDLTGEGAIDMPIPGSFNPQVFDAAENEIKYLVLTNTWPKFVQAGFEAASQASQREEAEANGSKSFLCGLKFA
ncbi:hypothetical protein F4809DRAFT_344722 [Biscogniauxia mediterranea]|nr:hypothetical protein F4809DRAFT_344722 [Biscogniauxia mediterranea]